jgi:hypothetical protein
MDEKISLEALALYGDTYAEKVLTDFFENNDKISGSEILKLCNVQQVNLLVIRELFKTWKEENKKLKSPYFNYEQEEVKEALENLMGILSKNISIGRAHFEPLLKKATQTTLLSIFAPYNFFAMTVSGDEDTLDVSAFRDEIKYIKINKQPLEAMLEHLEQKGVSKITGNEAFSALDHVLEEVNFTPEDAETYVEQFSQVIPLDPADFFIPNNPPVQKIQAPPTPAPKPSQPVNTAPQRPAAPLHEPRVNKPRVPTPPPAEQPTLNDRMAKPSKPSLASNFQKIEKIKESLTINQKFMFTKVLFHGDFELFSKAIDRIDQLDTLNAALRYIDEEYASTWDRDSEEFHEFMELVEKRFL